MSRQLLAFKKHLNRRRMILIVTCVVVFVSLGFRVNGNSQDQPQLPELTPEQKAKLPTVISTSIAIRRVARILEAGGIGIEAGQLFSRNGRKKLRPQLSAFPEMRLSKVQSEPLRGVIIADRLTLSEKLEIEADTVIIANHIVFSGRAPLIKGPHDFHLFPLESFKSENGRGTVITVDTSSGVHGIDGIKGLAGANGQNGGNGSAGDAGSCSTSQNGENGDPGVHGTSGASGGAGTNGSDGGDAGHQTLPISNIDVGVFYVIATGGNGGNGGHGGNGGRGGNGGSGGHGGNGASCKCDERGNGYGGNGGAAGAGGESGSGGKGGDGGKGGNAGNIVIYYPFTYGITTITMKTSGGLEGLGGVGGVAGPPGVAGMPGLGGRGGNISRCERGPDGNRGLSGTSGVRGNNGERGTQGQRAEDSTSSWLLTGMPEPARGTVERAGYEPGATSGKCTEWLWVRFHCEDSRHSGWQCNETGRTYIGCF